MVFEQILRFIVEYQSLTTLAATFIGGEEILISLGFLAGQGAIYLWVVVLFSFIGIMLSDNMWFFIAKINALKRLKKFSLVKSTHDKFSGFLEKSLNGNRLAALMSTKFFYGLRIVTIMYLSRRGMPYWRFLFYNSLAILLWIGILIPLGWLAGRGFGDYINVFKNFERVLLIMIIFAIFIHFIKKGVNYYLKARIGKNN